MIRLEWLLSRAAEKCSMLKRPLVAASRQKRRCQMLRSVLPSESTLTVCCLLVRSLTYCRCRCLRVRGVPLGMRRTRPEYLDPKTSDRWVAADVLVREEPDEEEDEEGDGEEKEGEEEEDDEGYSE